MFWFLPYLVLRHSYALARTGERFAANDPWNGSRQTRFTIEVYKMVPKVWGLKAVADRKWLGPDFFLIRSEMDGRKHWLPESLAELWRTKRVPTAALPRLLHELEPHLRKSSYFPFLHYRRMEWFGVILGVVCLGLLILDWITVVPEDGMRTAAAVALVCALLGGGVPAVFITRGLRERTRCRAEMERILASGGADETV